jgi:GT2 family glycosyltransferase
MEKIFTIIATYNGMQHNWIQKCFDSLLSSLIETKIIAIDNGSTDDSTEFIRKNYPQVDLINTNENLGFAKANNIGIKYALDQGADYVFLLNQDVWIESDTIKKLLEIFQSLPDAGIVSPIHLNGSKTNLDYGFVNYIANYNTPNFISDLYCNKLKDSYESQFVNAAAWLINRKCIESVGGFDTFIFYHYGEDDNYCQRVIYHGYKIYIATKTTICHDREERKGKWAEGHEKRGEDVGRRVYYANILLDDKIIDNAILSTRKRLGIRYMLLRMIRFKFKRAFLYRKKDKEDLIFYLTIKNSREQNKQGGAVWLKEDDNK